MALSKYHCRHNSIKDLYHRDVSSCGPQRAEAVGCDADPLHRRCGSPGGYDNNARLWVCLVCGGLGDAPGDFEEAHPQGGELGRGERMRLGDGVALRGAPGKTPFVAAAVETTTEGKPVRLKLRRVTSFCATSIAGFAKRSLDPNCSVVNDGLQCFASVADAGCAHQAVKIGSGPKAARPGN